MPSPSVLRSPLRDATLGILMMLTAVPAGLILAAAQPPGGGDSLGSLLPLAAYLIVLFALGFLRRRDQLAWSMHLGWVILCGVLASYVAWVESLVRYPADILMWAESSFVQDITHLRTGVPLYENPEHLASLFYPPFNQFATWVLATLTGHGQSVPAYRVIQLVWMVAASGIVVLVVRDLLRLAGDEREGVFGRHPVLASSIVAVASFLIGTNPITHPYAHNLHNDSLAVLISTLAFLMFTRYALTRRVVFLAVLSVLPMVGFLTKQSLAIWAPIGAAGIALLGGSGWLKRSVLFGGVALALVCVPMLGGNHIWGEHWHFWIIETLGGHPVSAARSLHHVLLTAVVPLMGVAAFLVLWSGLPSRGLLACWLVWLMLLGVETWTSGIAWMLNHIAPAAMLAGAWALAAIAATWPRAVWRGEATRRPLEAWLRATLLPVAGMLCLALTGAVRIPAPGLGPDAKAYRENLEQAVGSGRKPVLLDHGSWVFQKQAISVGDRSAAAGELGYSGFDVFSGIRERIRNRHYGRIIVRNYRTSSFLYDDSTWARSSGIRQALEDAYRVVDSFPGLAQAGNNPFLKPVWVLEPRPATEVRPAVD